MLRAMIPMSRSRQWVLLPALLVAACAQPTVEEIRNQAKADLYGLLRHTAEVLDQASNRLAVNDAATRFSQLGGQTGNVDLFEGYAFKPDVESFIADLEMGIPDIFSEANVVADIDDGKRFRVTLRQLCTAITADPGCSTDLAQVSIDLDVTLDNDTVRLAVAVSGQPTFASATLQSGRIAVDLDGAKAIAAIDAIATKTGGRPVDVQKLAGSWHLVWSKDGAGVAVEGTLSAAALEQPISFYDSLTNTSRSSLLKLAISKASFHARLGDGKAAAEGSLEPQTVVIPDIKKDLHFESGAISATASADGSGQVQLALRASAEPSGAVKIDGKTLVALTLNRGGPGEWVLTLAPHGVRTAVTLGAATKPRFEIHPEVYDETAQVMADPVLDGELSAQLSVVPRMESGVLFEIVGGSAKLSHGAQSLDIGAGSCLLEKDAVDPQSPLDMIVAGACP